MKSARIDENTQSSDTIVITVPDRAQMSDSTLLNPTIDNEFIMLDYVNQNDVQQQTLKISDVWTEAANYKKKLPHSNDDDVIVIEDDDDDLLDNMSNANKTSEIPTNNAMVKQSVVRSAKAKRLALPLVALDKLFTCKQCGK